MSDPENIDKIKQLTRKLMAEKNEHAIAQGVIESLRLDNESLRLDNESLSAKVLIRDQDLGWKNAEIGANALEMVRLCERISSLEIAQPAAGATPPAAGASEREKELQSALKDSQDHRNELRLEFEGLLDQYEKSDKFKIFFQLVAEHDTPEMQSLTPDQFEKHVKRFFEMVRRQDPDDRQKGLDRGRMAWKWMSLTQHPDKNPNDPFATENFKAFNKAYQQFKE
jgi:hypothetical protein